MKRILTTLSQKWPEYLLEILVITVGILGAFALNNWNQGRVERLEERNILVNMHSEFKNNRNHLHNVLIEKQMAMESGMTLMKLMGAPKDSIDLLDLDRLFYDLLPSGAFAPSNNSINNIIQSGKLNYLTDENLVNTIYKYETSIEKVKDRETSLDIWNTQRILPLLADYISFKEMDSNGKFPWTGKSRLKKDYYPLFQDLTFENYLDNMLYVFRGNIMELQNTDSLMIKIIEQTK